MLLHSASDVPIIHKFKQAEQGGKHVWQTICHVWYHYIIKDKIGLGYVSDHISFVLLYSAILG